LPSRHPGLFDGALHLSGRRNPQFHGHARSLAVPPPHRSVPAPPFRAHGTGGVRGKTPARRSMLADLIALDLAPGVLPSEIAGAGGPGAFSLLHKIIFWPTATKTAIRPK